MARGLVEVVWDVWLRRELSGEGLPDAHDTVNSTPSTEEKDGGSGIHGTG